MSPADTWKHGLKSRGQPAARRLHERLAGTPSREATEPTSHRQGTSHATRATASRGRFLLKIHPGFPCKWPAEPWLPEEGGDMDEPQRRPLGERRQVARRPAPRGRQTHGGAQAPTRMDHSGRGGPALVISKTSLGQKRAFPLISNFLGGLRATGRAAYFRVTACCCEGVKTVIPYKQFLAKESGESSGPCKGQGPGGPGTPPPHPRAAR